MVIDNGFVTDKEKIKTVATTLEERISALEAQVAQLLAEKAEKKTDKNQVPWWQRRYGAFQDDEMYDEAMRLGAEYRRSQPTAAEEIEALEKAGIHIPQFTDVKKRVLEVDL